MTSHRSLYNLVFALTIVALPAASADAQLTKVGFIDRVHRDAEGEHRYVIFLPHGYTTDESWPVLLFLHSAGNRGNDGQASVHSGLAAAIRAREDTFEFITIFPQCEDTESSVRTAWSPAAPDGQRALEILKDVEQNFSTDKNRVYLTGASMGGFGVWAHAAADANRWAAIVPICGGGDIGWAKAIGQLPVWCFHGADDRAVLPEESQRMISALQAGGAQPRYSELANVGHEAWNAAYSNDELYAWLLQHRRGNAAVAPVATVDGSTAPPVEPAEPFISALDILNASYLRLGNHSLNVLGRAIPRMSGFREIQGELPDATTNPNTQVGPMNVRFSDISYRGRLGRSDIEATENGTLSITLRARNIVIHIRRTTIQGSGRSATCGPILIRVGHRRDLKLKCIVKPIVQERQLRLEVIDSTFRIPSDNWVVGYPEWVRGSGGGMTSSRVSSSLQQGFYNDRRRIEQQVLAALPEMLERLTGVLPLDPVSDAITGLWPLPVYKPRIELWPSGVQVDADGITLQLGISVAAISDQQVADGPKTIEIAVNEPHDASGKDFTLALAPSLFGPVSNQMIEAHVARVLVVDSPLKRLRIFAEREALSRFIPDLQHRDDVQLRAELVMRQPINMATTGSEDQKRMQLELPGVRCSIATREDDQSQWQPYLEVDFRIRHDATPQVVRPTPATRVLSLAWTGEAEIDLEARFAPECHPGNSDIDLGGLREVIMAGWNEWIESGPMAQMPLDDLELGPDHMRADRVAWDGDYLAMTFVPAGIVILNAADEAVSYETKGPFSDWSKPYGIDPGQKHRFGVAYPVACRFGSEGNQKIYTLSVGRRSEFRSQDDGTLDLFTLPDRAEPEGGE